MYSLQATLINQEAVWVGFRISLQGLPQAHWSNALYSIQTFCSPQIACHLAWRDTDSLFSRLRDWNACPIELRHPFLFYYGHVSSFAKTRMLKVNPPPPFPHPQHTFCPNQKAVSKNMCHTSPASPLLGFPPRTVPPNTKDLLLRCSSGSLESLFLPMLENCRAKH